MPMVLLSITLYAQNINRSLPYAEVLSQYKTLDSLSDMTKLFTFEKTDCGEPLHLLVISKSRIFDPLRLHEMKKCILFINNGIHPGEPDGIDASLQLANDLITKPLYSRMLENVVVCIIPVFNIDGALERGCCSRVNQNGPEEYGFRGNAKNLDLNRDFIKVDAGNTHSLINILRKWNPDVFIDTHVSDGADYQYTMTLIPTQHNKLNAIQGDFMKKKLTPALFEKMKDRNDEMSPYVQTLDNKEIPDSGIVGFLETPRYLCGYLSLFNTYSYISESHMLKPFDQRLKSTINLLVSLVEVCDEQKEKIIELRNKANETVTKEKNYFFNWTCDTSKKELIDFKGYGAAIKPSKVTGGNRLYYDHKQPYNKKIPYYDEYYPKDSIRIPNYFFISQAWEEIVHKLEKNGVNFIRIDRDSSATITATYITDFETVREPYEGHYLHYNVKTRTENQKIKMKKGDYLIPMPQKNMRYALETLIPRAVDSYFCWGFFDSFLQQKEWFSSYVYEDVAADLLEKDNSLKKEFEKWKLINPNADDYSQLNFIYQHSTSFEKTYRRYPIFSCY